MDEQAIELLIGKPVEEEWNWSRQIIESVSSGVTVSDLRLPDMPLVYANPAFERMTGYSRRESLGRNCRFLQGLDSDQPGLIPLRRALRAGQPVLTVLKNYRKDGSVLWNELYLSPIHDLEGRLTHYVGIQNDVTLRVELENRLAFLAQHDGLTGLANRSLLMDRIDEAIARSLQNGLRVAVLFFDVDNFKLVNDMFGHDAGDILLKQIADRLLAGTRTSETAARLGGDEFVVVLENLKDDAEAHTVMTRLTEQIQQPMTVCGQEFLPSASVGMARFPDDGNTPAELLRIADTAMYLAKHLNHQERGRSAARQSASPLK